MLKSYFILKSEEVFGLPNIKSAKKRVLVSQTKAMQNKAAKSALKTEIKKFEAAVAEGNRSEADVAYKVAVKAVDKAAAKGLLHKNNAAHKKSSMTKGGGQGCREGPAAQEQCRPQEEQHDHQAEQAGLSFCL